jgi:hypothetical protein
LADASAHDSKGEGSFSVQGHIFKDIQNQFVGKGVEAKGNSPTDKIVRPLSAAGMDRHFKVVCEGKECCQHSPKLSVCVLGRASNSHQTCEFLTGASAVYLSICHSRFEDGHNSPSQFAPKLALCQHLQPEANILELPCYPQGRHHFICRGSTRVFTRGHSDFLLPTDSEDHGPVANLAEQTQFIKPRPP